MPAHLLTTIQPSYIAAISSGFTVGPPAGCPKYAQAHRQVPLLPARRSSLRADRVGTILFVIAAQGSHQPPLRYPYPRTAAEYGLPPATTPAHTLGNRVPGALMDGGTLEPCTGQWAGLGRLRKRRASPRARCCAGLLLRLNHRATQGVICIHSRLTVLNGSCAAAACAAPLPLRGRGGLAGSSPGPGGPPAAARLPRPPG